MALSREDIQAIAAEVVKQLAPILQPLPVNEALDVRAMAQQAIAADREKRAKRRARK